MEEIINFVTGELSFPEFIKLWQSNAEIRAEAQKLISPELLSPTHPYRMQPSGYRSLEHCDLSLEKYVANHTKGAPNGVSFGNQLNIHTALSNLVVWNYPDVKPTTYYHDEFMFLLDVLGNYIGGAQAEQVISKLLQKYPLSLRKGERKALVKSELKELFKYKDKKPSWVQEPEWPVIKGKPMCYISRKRDGEKFEYLFRDQDTGKERIIIQYM